MVVRRPLCGTEGPFFAEAGPSAREPGPACDHSRQGPTARLFAPGKIKWTNTFETRHNIMRGDPSQRNTGNSARSMALKLTNDMFGIETSLQTTGAVALGLVGYANMQPLSPWGWAGQTDGPMARRRLGVPGANNRADRPRMCRGIRVPSRENEGRNRPRKETV